MRLGMPRLRTPTSRMGNGIDALGTSLDGLRLANPATPDPANKLPPSTTDAGGKKLCCDACDGPHLTAECPIYSKPRESHPDAKARPGLGAFGLKSAGNFTLKGASIVRQPADGACLFHSLSHGLQIPGVNATTLRARIAAWVQAHPDTVIAGDPLKDWVEWDTNLTVPKYAARVAKPSFWGGGIEMAATSHLFNANVHVYEANSASNGLKRISCFNVADFADKTPTTDASSTLATTPIRRAGSTTSAFTSTTASRASGFSPMGRRSLPSDLSRPGGSSVPLGDAASSSSASSAAPDPKPSPLRPAKPWLTSSSKVLSEAEADAAIAAAAANEGLSIGSTSTAGTANSRAIASRRGISSNPPTSGEPVTVHVLYRGGIHFDALKVPPEALIAAQVASDAAAATAASNAGAGKGANASPSAAGTPLQALTPSNTRKPITPRSGAASSAYASRTPTLRTSSTAGGAAPRLPGLSRPSSAGRSSTTTTPSSSSSGSSSSGLPPFSPINTSSGTRGEGGLGHSRSNSPRPPPSLRRLAANRTSAHTPAGLGNSSSLGSSSHGSVGYKGPGVRPTNPSRGSTSPRKPGASSLRERAL